MGTKLTEMRSGCFHAAMDDEPMFVLLARDPRAPDLVDEWADTREAEITRGNRPASDYAKVQEARQTAQSMREWRDANDGAWRAATLPFGDRMPPAPLSDVSSEGVRQAMPPMRPGDTFTVEHDGKTYRGKMPKEPTTHCQHGFRLDTYCTQCGDTYDDI